MTGWQFHLTCPYDGAPVEHVASGATNGWETRAVARCTECGTQLLLAVTVTAPNGAYRATPRKRAQLDRARRSVHTPSTGESVPAPLGLQPSAVASPSQVETI